MLNMALFSPTSKLFPVVYFICGLLEVLLVSGITYGWAAIVPVFKQEDFYGSLCNYEDQGEANGTLLPGSFNSSVGRNGSGSNRESSASDRGCVEQRERLNLVFNIAVFSLCGFTLPVGIFVDKHGPRASRIVGCILYSAAGIMFAFTTKELSSFLFPVFILFCIGGAFLSVSIYQVSNVIFTKVKSLVLCIMHGAFDSSAIILLLFKVLYDEGFHLKYISLTYTGISILVAVLISIILIPSYSSLMTWNTGLVLPVKGSMLSLHYIGSKLADYNPNIQEKNGTSSTENNLASARMSLLFNSGKLDAEDRVQMIAEPKSNGDTKDNEEKAAFPVPDTVSGSVCSALYLMELLFLSIVQLRLWFFIGSLDGYLEVMTGNDKEQVDKYINIFGYVQFFGVAVAPIIGLVFDRNLIGFRNGKQQISKKKSLEEQRLDRLKESMLPFALTNIMCMVFSVLTLMPWVESLVPCFILQVIVRGFLYADHAAFIGIAFKPQLFGTLYGLGIFLSGILGLLQFVLFVMTETMLGGDPFWVNLGLLVLVCFAYLQPIYLWYYCRKMKRRTKPKKELLSVNEC